MTKLAPLLARAGVDRSTLLEEDRRLIHEDPSGKWRFLFLKPDDVPTYVEYGAADVGVCGRDVLLERRYDLYEPLDLGIGRCKLVVAGPIDSTPLPALPRIATKFVRTATEHFASKGIQAEIIHVSGSVELAPLVGLADRIVDLVETGTTLKENNLEIQEVIREISSVLIANRAAYKLKHDEISPLCSALRQQVGLAIMEIVFGPLTWLVVSFCTYVYLRWYCTAIDPVDDFEKWHSSTPVLISIRCKHDCSGFVRKQLIEVLGKYGWLFNPHGSFPWPHYRIGLKITESDSGIVTIQGTGAKLIRGNLPVETLDAPKWLQLVEQSIPGSIAEVWLHGELAPSKKHDGRDRSRFGWRGVFSNGELVFTQMIGGPRWPDHAGSQNEAVSQHDQASEQL